MWYMWNKKIKIKIFLPRQAERRWCAPEGCAAPHLTVQVSVELRQRRVGWPLLLPPSPSLPPPPPGGSEEAPEASPAPSGPHKNPLPERSGWRERWRSCMLDWQVFKPIISSCADWHTPLYLHFISFTTSMWFECVTKVPLTCQRRRSIRRHFFLFKVYFIFLLLSRNPIKRREN